MIIQWRAIKIRARSPPRKKEKKKKRTQDIQKNISNCGPQTIPIIKDK